MLPWLAVVRQDAVRDAYRLDAHRHFPHGGADFRHQHALVVGFDQHDNVAAAGLADLAQRLAIEGRDGGAVLNCTMEQSQLAVLLANMRQHVARVAFDESALVRRSTMEDQRVEAQVDVLLDELDVIFRVG